MNLPVWSVCVVLLLNWVVMWQYWREKAKVEQFRAYKEYRRGFVEGSYRANEIASVERVVKGKQKRSVN